jgi:cytochrome c oxidase subunit II
VGGKERAVARRLPRAGKVAALVAVVAVTVTGCSIDNAVLRFGWPSGITPEAEQMRVLWTWATIAALAVGVLVWGLIFWSVAFHRKKKDDETLPRQFQYNVPLELFAVVLPTIMVCVLFFFTATTEVRVLAKDEDPDLTIDVIGFQWNWEFQYQGETTPDGEPVSTVGSSSEIPLLVLPTDRRIAFELESTDVIHSFWVPEFLFKRDVFPRPEKNNQDNVFHVSSIDEEGSFVGRCAELCGTYHSMMNFEVRALSPELYSDYIELRRQINSETGEPHTAAEALSVMNCGELCEPHAVTTQPFTTDRTAREASG